MHSRAAALATATSLLVTAGCASTTRLETPPPAGEVPISQVQAPASLEPVQEQTNGTVTEQGSPDLGTLPQAETDLPNQAEVAFVASAPSTPAPSTKGQGPIEMGPGVTGSVIRVGVPLPDKEVPLVEQLHYEETFRPNFRRVWNIVIRAINSTGGILGRRFEPIFLPGEPNAEAVCTHFTEEQDVVVVTGSETGAAKCLDRAGVVPVSYAYTLRGDTYRESPRLLTPTTIGHERALQLYVDGLLQQRFFDGDTKIGLIRFDTPEWARLSDEVIKPRLARYGLEIEEELRVTYPDEDGELAKAFAEGESGVQVFKAKGIDRVLTLDSGSWILPEFTAMAERQNYYPRYGLNSLNGGEWEMERNQLKGAVGIGWMPWLDLEPQHAYRHGSEGARRCKDLMDAAGASEEMDSYNEGLWTSSICDLALFLKAAVEAGGPSITADSIVAGAERLGTSFKASNTLMTRLGPGRHEGVAAIRFLQWFVGCQCFRYTSGLIDAG